MNWVVGNALHARMRVCDWSSLHSDLHLVTKKISSGEKAINPFALLALLDEPSMHQRAAQIYTQAECPANLILGPIASRDYIPVAPKKKKIRIGYFSADFKNHAVSILIPELLELHDRENFEVFAFSFGVDDQSFLRSQIGRAHV